MHRTSPPHTHTHKLSSPKTIVPRLRNPGIKEDYKIQVRLCRFEFLLHYHITLDKLLYL